MIWSFFMALSFMWNFNTEKSGTLEAARIEAKTAFEKDVTCRRWNAMLGGVYAPVSEITQPNPYLNAPERDIKTPLGKKLTKINPAYMTRQVHELTAKTYGVKGHITSLNPIRPENAPDLWEKKALMAFQSGDKEISSVEEMGSERYMRFMRPLVTEKGCLTCHGKQGYKLGDIRGGISVSVPLAPFMAIERHHVLTFAVWHGLIWLIGMAGIGLGMYLLNRQILRRQRAEEELRYHEKIQGVLEMAGAVCHEINQPLQAISVYSELLLMDMPEDENQYEMAEKIKNQVDRMGEITRKLMTITRYETKDYLKGKIIDIEQASK